MDSETRRSRLVGCYVTIPTMFKDPDLAVDFDAISRHVRFLVEGSPVSDREDRLVEHGALPRVLENEARRRVGGTR